MDRSKTDGAGTAMIICYYTNWAQYRPGEAKFVPEDIDVTLCTHLIYAFAKIENGVLTLNDEGMYQRFNDLKKKKPGLKTVLAVGGYGDGSKPFPQMVATDQSMEKFIDHSISFLRDRNFDGLDVDWEYPAADKSPPEDKGRFTKLLEELQKAFKEEASKTGKPKLLLSAAVSAGKEKIDAGYDVPKVAEAVDFLMVMGYDFHGSWNTETGLNSPLKPPSDTRTNATLNQDWAISYWMQKGTPANKLVLGLGFYGRSFTLSNPSNHGIGALASGAGQAGEYTREAGMLSYYEICQKLRPNSGWEKDYDNVQNGVYAYGGNQWVGYDDPKSIQAKAEYIKSKKLAGAMVWSLDMDDFNGKFGDQGPYPLLRKVAEVLGVK